MAYGLGVLGSRNGIELNSELVSESAFPISALAA